MVSLCLFHHIFILTEGSDSALTSGSFVGHGGVRQVICQDCCHKKKNVGTHCYNGFKS